MTLFMLSVSVLGVFVDLLGADTFERYLIRGVNWTLSERKEVLRYYLLTAFRMPFILL